MSSLYMCFTCGKWSYVNLFFLAMMENNSMKPVCPVCNTIMYNVLETDKLELMEEPEPEPVE